MKMKKGKMQIVTLKMRNLSRDAKVYNLKFLTLKMTVVRITRASTRLTTH